MTKIAQAARCAVVKVGRRGCAVKWQRGGVVAGVKELADISHARTAVTSVASRLAIWEGASLVIDKDHFHLRKQLKDRVCFPFDRGSLVRRSIMFDAAVHHPATRFDIWAKEYFKIILYMIIWRIHCSQSLWLERHIRGYRQPPTNDGYVQPTSSGKIRVEILRSK